MEGRGWVEGYMEDIKEATAIMRWPHRMYSTACKKKWWGGDEGLAGAEGGSKWRGSRRNFRRRLLS